MKLSYRILMVLLPVCAAASLHAQVTASGMVADSSGKPVAAASVTLVKKNGVILAFAITNAGGGYKLRHTAASVKDTLSVTVSALGFAKQTVALVSADQRSDFRLRGTKEVLPNVTVNSRSMLRREGDTLNYDVASFSEKQDRTIGDVIKKLPGVEVDDRGQISYGGKPINRFYIEGDNLLDGKYNIATKSIPSDAVSKVQVLENHQPAKVLKDLVPSDQAAMNIVLKDKARLRLMGTGDAAAGTPGVYNASANLMLFRKQVKFINYTKLNNTGNDLADDVTNFFGSENTPPASLMSASTAGTPDISRKRSLFNNAVLVTANDLVNLKKDWQLRINAHFLADKQFQSYRYRATYYLPNDTVRYAEALDSRKSTNTFNTQFTLTANREDYLLNNVTILENTPQEISSSLLATGNGALAQKFSGTTANISNRFNLIRKLRRGSSYELYSFLNRVSNPATLQVRPGLFAAQLNNGQPYAGLEQTGAVPTWYTENYLSFGIPGSKLKQRYRVGFNYQQQELNSLLSSEQNSGSKALVADSFINRLEWNRLRVYVQADYSYITDKIVFSLSLPLVYQNIRYTGRKQSGNLRDFPVTPRVSLRYNTGQEDFVSLGYSYGNNWGGIDQVYDGYIMRSYRDFYSNGSLLNESTSHSLSASYNFRNTLKIFFFSLGVSYSVFERNTISRQQISSLVQQASLIPFNNGYSSIATSASISKYLFPLMTTIGGKLGWSRSRANQFQNGDLLAVQNDMYVAGLNTNTKFASWLTVGYNGSFTASNASLPDGGKRSATPAVKKWLHSADAAITLSKTLTAKLAADNYTYLVPGAQDVRVTFADLYLTYYLDKLKSNIEFSLTNIMGTDEYTNVSMSANSISSAAYTIRPRMALLKCYFRF
ncbi:TonB-dependent receptor [Sediminibacterium soli]|uniref:TonB-dependent receptor n=1 Tax=Sediminibacterium soli TaxID=2698829 RepID=UPI00137B7123|nr:TonB-dependent receptor [Sediminibacterium soli]NCI45953.1 TonB-dependent receptor [Sediminibacterium soli]